MEIALCPTAWTHNLLDSKRLGQLLFSKSVILCTHNLSRRVRLAPLHNFHCPWSSSHGLGMASVLRYTHYNRGCIFTSDLSWSLKCQASAALHRPVNPAASMLPTGAMWRRLHIARSGASLRCIHSLLWTPASLCWPWGNMSQRISCLWLWSLINGRLFFSSSDLSNIICHRKTKVSLTVCHMNGPDKVFASL